MGRMTRPILTLTLSPSIDLSCEAHGVSTGHKTRTSANRFDPGGGGLNVAKVIHALGGDVRALLLLGGVTGHFIADLLHQPHQHFAGTRLGNRKRLNPHRGVEFAQDGGLHLYLAEKRTPPSMRRT